MQYEFHTKFTYEMQRELYFFSAIKSKHYHIFEYFCKYCLPVAMILLEIFCIYFVVRDNDQTFLIISLVFPVLLLLVIFYYYLMPRIMYRATKKLAPGGIACRFCDDYFQVENKSPQVSSSSQYKYDIIERIYETNNYFYLMITKRHAVVVPKANCKAPDEFRRFLIAKSGEAKYKMKM